jgi:hypothetical protein
LGLSGGSAMDLLKFTCLLTRSIRAVAEGTLLYRSDTLYGGTLYV